MSTVKKMPILRTEVANELPSIEKVNSLISAVTGQSLPAPPTLNKSKKETFKGTIAINTMFDKELSNTARKLAIDDGATFSDIVNEALRQYLKQRNK